MVMWTALFLLVAPAVEGSGVPVSETREFRGFTRVASHGNFVVTVTQAKRFEVVVTADDNLFPLVVTTVKDGTLHLDEAEPLQPKSPIRINVRAPRVDAVMLAGGGNMVVRAVKGASLETTLSGEGTLDAQANVNTWKVRVSGAGDATLAGRARTLEVSLSGAGNIHARAVSAVRVRARVSGAGTAEVTTRDVVDAQVSGAGGVRYGGNPKTVTKKVSGVGSVTPL